MSRQHDDEQAAASALGAHLFACEACKKAERASCPTGVRLLETASLLVLGRAGGWR